MRIHLLPHVLAPVLVAITFGIPGSISLEASLSFLGIGVTPPMPSWGTMIAESLAAMRTYPPAVALPRRRPFAHATLLHLCRRRAARRARSAHEALTVTMQPEDIFALRSADDAQPSPDGQRIAFVVTELDRASDQALSSIWLVPLVGGTPRRLTTPAHPSSQPRWSPDGQVLAFISSAERGAQVWLVALDGGEPVRLTEVPGGVTGPPVWSPNGRRIAFTARLSPAVAGAPRVIRRLRYLLNGAGYIGDGFWHVFTVPVDRACPAPAVQLTSGEWHHFSPGWSPDSTQITCITTRRDDWDIEWVWDVYVLDAEDCGATPRLVTDSQGVCAAPAWSPDGQWIAYYANECPGTAYTQDYYLWLVPDEWRRRAQCESSA